MQQRWEELELNFLNSEVGLVCRVLKKSRYKNGEIGILHAANVTVFGKRLLVR